MSGHCGCCRESEILLADLLADFDAKRSSPCQEVLHLVAVPRSLKFDALEETPSTSRSYCRAQSFAHDGNLLSPERRDFELVLSLVRSSGRCVSHF